MRLQALSDALNPLSPLTNLSLSSPHRVLVVGCAYGGVSAVVNLLDLDKGKPREMFYPSANLEGRKSRNGIEVTVIDERDGYFHSVGAPLAHVAPQHTVTMWKRFNYLNEFRQSNLHFKHGSVKKIDPENKEAEWIDRSGVIQKQAYDYLIMATGLKRPFPAVPRPGTYEDYLRDGKAFISKIVGGDLEKPQEGRRVAIIGAGAVGVEFAGEIKNYYPGIKVTLIHSRDRVLSSEPLPDELKDKVGEILLEEGVEVLLGNRASIAELPSGESEITLADGKKVTADFVIDSTKKGTPTTDVLPESCLNDDKEITVEHDLTFKNIPNASSHFGVGDVIAWTGIKRAGSAMVMGQTTAQNVYCSILNSESTSSSKNASQSESSSDPSSEQKEPYKLTELPSWEAVIGLAVGKQCLTYDKQNGMKWGVEVMKNYFGDDLGWARNLQYMQLTDIVEDKKEEKQEEVRIGEVGVEPVSAAA